MRWFASNGALLGDVTETIPPNGKRLCEAQELFGRVEGIRSGFLEIQSSGGRLTGSLTFGDPERARFSYVAPLVTTVSETVVVPYLASDDTFFTALSLVNPSTEQATATLKLHLPSGEVLAETTTQIGAGLRLSGLLTEFFPELAGTPMHGGYLTIESDQALAAFALYVDGSRLSFTSITENRQPSPEMPKRGPRLLSAPHFAGGVAGGATGRGLGRPFFGEKAQGSPAPSSPPHRLPQAKGTRACCIYFKL